MKTFQHYVPRTYLTGFVDPATPPSDHVWVWDIKAEKSWHCKPDNIGGENDFYESVGVTSGLGAGIEARLAIVEHRVRDEIDRIVRQAPNVASFDERLGWFLATLCVRTPWGRRAFEEWQTEYSVPPALAALSAHERWAAVVEYLAGWVGEYFRRMDWLLVGPHDSSAYFITSDRPVVLTGDHMDGSVGDVLRLTDKSSIVSVPITSRLALIGSYDRARFLSDGVIVKWVNDRTLRHAERFLLLPQRPYGQPGR
jgi:hypothetical protein